MSTAVSIFKKHATLVHETTRQKTPLVCNENITANFQIEPSGDFVKIVMESKGWWSNFVSATIDFDRFSGDEVVVKLEEFSCSSGGRNKEIACEIEAMRIKADSIQFCADIVSELLNPSNGVKEFMTEYFSKVDVIRAERNKKRKAEQAEKQKKIDEAKALFAAEHVPLSKSEALKSLTNLANATKADKPQKGDHVRKVRIITAEYINERTGELNQDEFACQFYDNRVTFHLTTHSTPHLTASSQLAKADVATRLEGCRIVGTRSVLWSDYKRTLMLACQA